MATFVSGLYTGWAISTAHPYYTTVTGDIYRSGTTVTLSNMVMTTTFGGSGSVRYDSSTTRQWGIKNPGGGWLSQNTVTYNKGTYYPGNNLFSVGINSGSFTLSDLTATSATLYVNSPDGDFAFTLSGIPSGASKPTGLAVNNISATQNTISGTVSITGWGVGGSAASYYREINVSSNGSTDKRRLQKVYGSSLSSVITATNSSEMIGVENITPNKMYYVWAYATNGAASDVTSYTGKSVVTLPPELSDITVSGVDVTTATVTFTTDSDGGKYSKEIFYKLDNGGWVSAGTVSTAASATITKNLTGLLPGHTYTLGSKVVTTAGETVCDDVEFTTLPAAKIVRTSGVINALPQIIKPDGTKIELSPKVIR